MKQTYPFIAKYEVIERYAEASGRFMDMEEDFYWILHLSPFHFQYFLTYSRCKSVYRMYKEDVIARGGTRAAEYSNTNLRKVDDKENLLRRVSYTGDYAILERCR